MFAHTTNTRDRKLQYSRARYVPGTVALGGARGALFTMPSCSTCPIFSLTYTLSTTSVQCRPRFFFCSTALHHHIVLLVLDLSRERERKSVGGHRWALGRVGRRRRTPLRVGVPSQWGMTGIRFFYCGARVRMFLVERNLQYKLLRVPGATRKKLVQKRFIPTHAK